jgi:hypothetical protein
MIAGNYNSNEELYFSWYLEDLIKYNIVTRYMYESNSFLLSPAKKYTYNKRLVTKLKSVELHLMDEHIYTPDFLVEWNEDYNGIFYRDIDGLNYTTKPPFFCMRSKKNGKAYTFFEVKADFDRNNMTRLFKINQKWLYDKYKLYITLISIPDLFKKTFIPERYFFTDSARQPRKINFGIKTFDEYYKWLKESKYDRKRE